MKRTLIALAILTSLVAVVSFGVARWSVRRAAVEPVMNLHDAGWLKQELKLTDGQAADIAKLEAEFSKTMESCCEKHCAARFELSQSMTDPAKARACVEKMCAAQNESERATLEHILRVRNVLTPAQQQQYAKLVSQQVCTACPLGLHRPMP